MKFFMFRDIGRNEVLVNVEHILSVHVTTGNTVRITTVNGDSYEYELPSQYSDYRTSYLKRFYKMILAANTRNDEMYLVTPLDIDNVTD